jgi:hypothetical protein
MGFTTAIGDAFVADNYTSITHASVIFWTFHISQLS